MEGTERSESLGIVRLHGGLDVVFNLSQQCTAHGFTLCGLIRGYNSLETRNEPPVMDRRLITKIDALMATAKSTRESGAN
jgi:hypothetical protein